MDTMIPINSYKKVAPKELIMGCGINLATNRLLLWSKK